MVEKARDIGHGRFWNYKEKDRCYVPSLHPQLVYFLGRVPNQLPLAFLSRRDTTSLFPFPLFDSKLQKH